MTKQWLWLCAFGVALVVNPYLACSSPKESDFDYSEAEMKDAVLGTWLGTAEVDGEEVDFSLTLEQAPAKAKTQSPVAPAKSPQCAQRSFVKPAAACLNVSEMPVIGSITSVNPALNGAVDGYVQAFRSLGPANISLRTEGGVQLAGSIEKQALSDGTLSGQAGDSTFSLSRP